MKEYEKLAENYVAERNFDGGLIEHYADGLLTGFKDGFLKCREMASECANRDVYIGKIGFIEMQSLGEKDVD